MGYLKTNESEKRYSIFPIRYQDVWEMYKSASKQHWDAQEIDLSGDKYDELETEEQLFLDNILAFFNVSDSLVISNLEDTLIKETDMEEAQFFYGYQRFNEGVHQETYSLMTDVFIKEPKKKQQMFEAVKYNPVVAKKVEWVEQWINNSSYAHKLVAFATIEGISFSSLFAGAFWFRTRNKMLGFCSANDFIMRDEHSHYEFALFMYKTYLKDEYKLSKEVLRSIILGAYETEEAFVEGSLPEGLKGLTKKDMIQYVQFVTDIVLKDFGLEPEFKVRSPLDYMAKIGLDSKSNFFEQRTGEYTRMEAPDTFEISEDF